MIHSHTGGSRQLERTPGWPLTWVQSTPSLALGLVDGKLIRREPIPGWEGEGADPPGEGADPPVGRADSPGTQVMLLTKCFFLAFRDDKQMVHQFFIETAPSLR